ncbi:hypothetical protein SGLAM104S_00249 [Streptomyces glaucescens]
MDALAALLAGPRARGALLIRACFDPPWAVRVADRAPLTVMVMARGDAWITPENGCRCGWPPANWPSPAAPPRTPAPTTPTRNRRR